MTQIALDSVTPDDLATIAKLQRIVGEINAANGWTTGEQLRRDVEHYRATVDPENVVMIALEQRLVEHQISVLALITTEVAEAIEEVRNGHGANESRRTIGGVEVVASPIGNGYVTYSAVEGDDKWTGVRTEIAKLEGIPSELADVVIRALDFANTWEIDLAGAIVSKLAYNATRGHRHGGKTL